MPKHVARPFNVLYMDMENVYSCGCYEACCIMVIHPCCVFIIRIQTNDNKVRELIAVKVPHTSLLNSILIAFKVLPLGSYAPMPAPSPPFKTILELVLWSGLQSCRCITPDVIDVIKIPSFQYFLYLREQKESHLGLDPLNIQGVPTQLLV